MSQSLSHAAQSGNREAWAREVAALADDGPDGRQAVADLFASPDAFDRDGVEYPERERFKRFCDVVTYRWLSPKPEPWHPVPDHALDWHWHFHEGDYSPMILAGRKHTKSTWVLCEILDNCQYTPHFACLYWCNNAENQLPKRMAELEEMIEANLWLDNLHHGKPDNKNNIPQSVKFKQFPGNDSKLEAAGVGGGIEGSHFNMVVGDDPLKEMGDIPDEDILQYYKNVIVPMADGTDLTAIVGTRKRPKDIYHLIREVTEDLDEFDIQGYRLLEYPAVREVWTEKYGERPENLADVEYHERHAPDLADVLEIDGDTVSVLWPEARGTEFLLGKLARQGKAAFVREFCMVFTHVKDAIIERDLVDGPPVSLYTPEGAPPAPRTLTDAEEFIADWTEADTFKFDRVAIGLDLALVEGGDNTAWVVVGATGDERYVLAVEHDDGIKPERIRRTTKNLYERYEADIIVVEKNGWQDWFADEAIQFDEHLPIKKHSTTQRKHSWQRGVPKIASDIEAGKYRFFRDDDGIEALIDGLCSLRMDDNDALAGHTPDVVMALYMTSKGLRSGSGGVVNLDPTAPDDPDAQAREEEKRQKLRGNELGEGILNQIDGRRRGRFR